MRFRFIFIIMSLLFIPTEVSSAAGNNDTGVVVLTADQVRTAVDIENAFHIATDSGAHPGMVILDGRRGPFQYDPAYGLDVDINIFYSDLILRGENNAAIQGGGIYFDGMMLENIIIENLTMHCPGDCMISWGGPHRNVTIHANNLIATGYGIQVAETDGWKIHGNTIQAGWVAVDMIMANRIMVNNNRLAGYIPVMLYNSEDCKVVNNTALGSWDGVMVANLSFGNLVTANTIFNVENSGIILGAETQGNKVHGNWVVCAAEADCQTVRAPDDVWDVNKISGNRP
jgi:parallel beta-helix repeat protein